MNRTINFFLRFDIIQKASCVLVLFFALLMYWCSSMKFDATRTAFLISCIVIFAIGCTLKAPKAGDITDYLVKHREEFEKATMKANKLYRTYDHISVYAFDKELEKFARTVGNRLLYPVCLNLMFVRHPDGVTLTAENYSLFKKRKPVSTTYTFGKKETFTMNILRLEGDAEMLWVTLSENGAEQISFYARDDHLWKQFYSYIQGAATITEETA